MAINPCFIGRRDPAAEIIGFLTVIQKAPATRNISLPKSEITDCRLLVAENQTLRTSCCWPVRRLWRSLVSEPDPPRRHLLSIGACAYLSTNWHSVVHTYVGVCNAIRPADLHASTFILEEMFPGPKETSWTIRFFCIARFYMQTCSVW